MNGVDNPEIVSFFVPIFAIGFIVWAAYWVCYGYMNADKIKPFKFPDRFDIGYIDDPAPQQPTTIVNNITIPPVEAKPVPPQGTDPARGQFKEQCALALQGLGEPITKARKITNDILDAHPEIQDIATFLRKAVVK